MRRMIVALWGLTGSRSSAAMATVVHRLSFCNTAVARVMLSGWYTRLGGHVYGIETAYAGLSMLIPMMQRCSRALDWIHDTNAAVEPASSSSTSWSFATNPSKQLYQASLSTADSSPAHIHHLAGTPPTSSSRTHDKCGCACAVAVVQTWRMLMMAANCVTLYACLWPASATGSDLPRGS